jgi:hypothetical protein
MEILIFTVNIIKLSDEHTCHTISIGHPSKFPLPACSVDFIIEFANEIVTFDIYIDRGAVVFDN